MSIHPPFHLFILAYCQTISPLFSSKNPGSWSLWHHAVPSSSPLLATTVYQYPGYCPSFINGSLSSSPPLLHHSRWFNKNTADPSNTMTSSPLSFYFISPKPQSPQSYPRDLNNTSNCTTSVSPHCFLFFPDHFYLITRPLALLETHHSTLSIMLPWSPHPLPRLAFTAHHLYLFPL